MSDPHDQWNFRWPEELQRDANRKGGRVVRALMMLAGVLAVLAAFWWVRP